MTKKSLKKDNAELNKILLDKVLRNNPEKIPKKSYDYLDHCLSKVSPGTCTTLGLNCQTEDGRKISSFIFVHKNRLELLALIELTKVELMANIIDDRNVI